MTTYSVQDTLITALRVLCEGIFALWVTYSLSSFTFNRRENWSTENRADLLKFTALSGGADIYILVTGKTDHSGNWLWL